MPIAEELKKRIDLHEEDLQDLLEADPQIEDVLEIACDCLVSWGFSPSATDFGEVDAIVAFSFGLGEDSEPGRMNQGLAAFIRTVRDEHGCGAPIMAQWEIADVLNGMGIEVEFRAIRRGRYLSTLGVWNQIREFLWREKLEGRERRFENILLVAHPDHMFRCKKIMERYGEGIRVVVPDRTMVTAALKRFGCDNFGFDKDSSQPWTRDRAIWVRHDLSSRLSAFSKGDIYGPREPLYPFECPTKYIGNLKTALAALPEDQRNKLFPILLRLFEICFDDLKKAEIGNPMIHHFIVLEHMMKIALAENFSQRDIKRAAALSLLHDIAAVEKITKEHVGIARRKDKALGDALELRRQQNRKLHMREGGTIAQKRLLELNESLSTVVFDANDIDAICTLIGIHDNPSLNIPIPRSEWMMAAFREADRLWMMSLEGVKADLLRKGNTNPTSDEIQKQLKYNYSRFKDERNLYSPSEGPFVDSESFFRTKKGWEISREYREGVGK